MKQLNLLGRRNIGQTKVTRNADGSYFIDAWDSDSTGNLTSTRTVFKPIPGNQFEVTTQTIEPNGKITLTKHVSDTPPISTARIQEQNSQRIKTEKLIHSFETKMLTNFGLTEDGFQRTKQQLSDRADLRDPLKLSEAAIAITIAEIPTHKLVSYVKSAMDIANISPERTRQLLKGEVEYEDTLFSVEQSRFIEICSALKVLNRIGLEDKSKKLLEQLLP